MWRFRYDEDGFVVAQSDSFDETVCRAVSDFFDGVRSLRSTERLLVKWGEIKRNYPQDPTGVAFNATRAELTGGGKVIIESLYDQFPAIELPESEFSCAARCFRDFLRAQPTGHPEGSQ